MRVSEGRILLLVAEGFRDEDALRGLAKRLITDRVIFTYVLIEDVGLIIQTDLGNYLLNEELPIATEGATYMFVPFSFADFGGSFADEIWDDIQKTFVGSMEEIIAAHDKLILEKATDSLKLAQRR